MKILIDMNLSPLWVSYLAGHGFDAEHWSRVGQPSAPDREIFEFAVTNSYVIFTHDLDFGMLLSAQGAKSPSVIQVRAQNVLPGAIGEIVVRAIKTAELQLKQGALLTVDPVNNGFGCCRSNYGFWSSSAPRRGPAGGLGEASRSISVMSTR